MAGPIDISGPIDAPDPTKNPQTDGPQVYIPNADDNPNQNLPNANPTPEVPFVPASDPTIISTE